MYKLLFLEPNGFRDLYVSECGFHGYDDNYDNASGIKNNFGAYLIHFVIKGKGKILKIDRNQVVNEYGAKTGEVFLIPPENIYDYRPEYKDPWYYYWIALKGDKAREFVEGLNLLINPVAKMSNSDILEQQFLNLLEAADGETKFNLNIASKMYSLLLAMNEGCNKISDFRDANAERIAKVKAYILLYKSKKITVEQVAAHLGIDRSYLYTLFIENMGMSPSDYIKKIKMDYACAFLIDGKNRSVKEVAYLTGFSDPQHFSRAFTKAKGLSPLKWKAMQLASDL